MDVAATSLDASASARAHRASTEAMARARLTQCPVSFLASDADATARMTASASGREGGWSWEGFVARARRAGERARAGAGRGVEREAVRDAGETAGGGRTSDAGRGTSREDLGRATWVFLHTLAAQFPEEPTKRQERDARELISIMTRLYPCGECARHFEEIVRRNPPDCSSGLEFQRWMCAVHNEVNASLGKPMFDCSKTSERWSRLDCGDDGESSACSLEDRRRRIAR